MSSQQALDAEKAPWLGLLKWSLNYVDGTVPSSESKNFKAMSEEDKKFLEEVMKNGIVDEGDRMTVILNSLVSYLDSCLNVSKDNDSNENDSSEKVPSLEEVEEMMMELQDIVEQIDFAKSFASMGGLQFLIGCASASASASSAQSSSSSSSVPGSIRAACLGILATLCQNNPAVQMMMLEQGNIPKLIQIYFDQFSSSTSSADGEDSSSAITSKAMQAMSSSVRNHDVAEKIFCMNDDGIKMVETGLGMYSSSSSSLSIPPPSAALRRRALFFLQALITSDTADGDRVRLFKAAIQFVAGRYLDLNTGIDGDMMENDSQTREMALSMITRILDQKNSVDALTEKGVHSFLVSLGVKRVSTMRSILDADEKEIVAEELKLWEGVISRLSKAQ